MLRLYSSGIFSPRRFMNAGWIEALQSILLANRITHIFPAHDEALLAVAVKMHHVSARSWLLFRL